MRSSLISALMMLAGLCLVAGCGRKSSPLAGGGEHKIDGLRLEVKGGATECRVGDEVQLDVGAYWAIPSRTNETAKSQYKVEPPEMGEVRSNGVFVPAKAGKAIITATFVPTEYGFPNQVFTAKLEMTVKE